MRVALVVMPFAAADSPSLAAGLLKASLNESGIACDVKYFNVTFAAMLGSDDYQKLATQFPSTVLAGEWSFSRLLFPDRASDWPTYRDQVLRHPRTRVEPEKEALVRRVASAAPLFLQLVADSTDWSSYDLIGFTSNFEQTMPAMALANKIRERAPRSILVAGGANFEAGMGRALFEELPFLDYVCLGEGDVALPQLCDAIATGRQEIPAGMIGREKTTSSARPAMADLDSLPIPDFDDYFRAITKSPSFTGTVHPWIPLEASRGCWWGEKSHCTFCGLNGERMAFRHKSPERVASEVRTLCARYGYRWFQFADNILSMKLFDALHPIWSSEVDTPPKFFEVKSGMKREQILRLREAGVVRVQAGIESFSTATLKLMKKGVSAALNVAVLRWCREAGVNAQWNLLWGFPGEPLEDYETQFSIAERLTHLDPPQACCEIRLDRFSPNHTAWRSLGFTEIRPAAAYEHVFPFDPSVIEEIAYFFDFEHPAAEHARHAATPLDRLARTWRAKSSESHTGTFAVLPNIDGRWMLVDRRFNQSESVRSLTHDEIVTLMSCDEPLSPNVLRKRSEIDERVLEEMIRIGAILEIDERLVTLPLLSERLRNEVNQRRDHAQPQEVPSHC